MVIRVLVFMMKEQIPASVWPINYYHALEILGVGMQGSKTVLLFLF